MPKYRHDFWQWRKIKSKIEKVPFYFLFLAVLLICVCCFSSLEPTEAKVIDGKKIAEDIRGELREQIKEWMTKANQRAPQLTAVIVGEDAASHTYVKNKMKVRFFFGEKIQSILRFNES